MDQLFSDFPKVSKAEWEDKLTRELKGADFEISLKRKDEVEELSYATYAHTSDGIKSHEIPGRYPFKRGYKSIDNDWNIAAVVEVSNEKKSNQQAMDLLMTGCTSLVFHLKNEKIDWTVLFDQIGFEFIEVQFSVRSLDQFQELVSFFASVKNTNVMYRLDFFATSELNRVFNQFASVAIESNIRFCHVDAFGLQQCGANSIQEVAYAIACGNEYIVKLMELGYSADQAVLAIHFSLGTVSNYFYEISKIRAFRALWSKVIKAYGVSAESSAQCNITAEIGHMNKSLKDPYTNLLRQTTEGMSAVIGGVETLLIHPYDARSTNGVSPLSSRMAMNISLVLKEESYFDKVIDPIGGSYSIEQLTEQIAEKSWDLFRKIDEKGGVEQENALEYLCSSVSETAKLRLEQIKSGKRMLIGVNKYPNPQVETNSWLPGELFQGMKKIIFETDI